MPCCSVCKNAVLPKVVMIALCLLMLSRSKLLFVCVHQINIQLTLLFVVNARMNFREYGILLMKVHVQ